MPILTTIHYGHTLPNYAIFKSNSIDHGDTLPNYAILKNN